MKVRVLFKMPDARDQVLSNIDLEDEETDESEALDKEIALEVFDRYVAFGESLNCEIDTDAGTMICLPLK